MAKPTADEIINSIERFINANLALMNAKNADDPTVQYAKDEYQLSRESLKNVINTLLQS